MSLGEFYTPRWLAEIILDASGYDGSPGLRLLDPSCGPGVFLVLAIARARRHRATARDILSSIQGYELNPESAQTARANYLVALGDLAGGLTPADIPIFCLDAILDTVAHEPFDFVVGNRPRSCREARNQPDGQRSPYPLQQVLQPRMKYSDHRCGSSPRPISHPDASPFPHAAANLQQSAAFSSVESAPERVAALTGP